MAARLYWKKGLGLAFGYAVFGFLLWASAVPCLFAMVTHGPCPGCGSTRAVFALMRGDLHGVFRMNPVGPVVAVILAVFASLSIHSMLVTGDLKRFNASPVTKRLNQLVLGLAVVSFMMWIVRFFGWFGGPVPV